MSTNPAGREKKMHPNGPPQTKEKEAGRGAEINDTEAGFNKEGTEE